MLAHQPVSPRLAALQRAIEAAAPDALSAFWAEVAAHGTPLIEPIAGDDRQLLVTFLWRASEPVERVVVEGGLDGWGANLAGSQMRRLGETDLWYRTSPARADIRTFYRLSPNDSLVPLDQVTDWPARTATWQPDPLNPQVLALPGDPDDPDARATLVSLLELPAAPPQPWVARQAGVAAGQLARHRLASAALGNQRSVWVYTPPGYTASAGPYPLLIQFDGDGWIEFIPTPTILDNLIAAGMLPPLIAVFVGNAGGPARARELPCNPLFADFLAGELLTWVRERYAITIDPARTAVSGASYGGLAAAYAALRHPERFGNVLAQSGSFWWQPAGDPEPEWLARQFAERPALPLRFYLDVGILESNDASPPNQLIVNRHLRTVLRAKGYPVAYAEFAGGHDMISWRGTLADGLLALFGPTAAR